MTNPYKQYAKIKRDNASPLEQVALLLDHAGNLLSKAHKALLEGRIEDRFRAIDQTFTVLSGLLSALNPNPSAESASVAQTMEKFYHDLFKMLMDINKNQDPDLCEKAIYYLREMAQLWREIDQERRS